MDPVVFSHVITFIIGAFVGGLFGILIGAEMTRRAKAANPPPGNLGDPLPQPHTIGRLDLP